MITDVILIEKENFKKMKETVKRSLLKLLSSRVTVHVSKMVPWRSDIRVEIHYSKILQPDH